MTVRTETLYTCTAKHVSVGWISVCHTSVIIILSRPRHLFCMLRVKELPCQIVALSSVKDHNKLNYISIIHIIYCKVVDGRNNNL